MQRSKRQRAGDEKIKIIVTSWPIWKEDTLEKRGKAVTLS